jgi:hypothetical protein
VTGVKAIKHLGICLSPLRQPLGRREEKKEFHHKKHKKLRIG